LRFISSPALAMEARADLLFFRSIQIVPLSDTEKHAPRKQIVSFVGPTERDIKDEEGVKKGEGKGKSGTHSTIRGRASKRVPS
jgi:hypothetical protein